MFSQFSRLFFWKPTAVAKELHTSFQTTAKEREREREMVGEMLEPREVGSRNEEPEPERKIVEIDALVVDSAVWYRS